MNGLGCIVMGAYRLLFKAVLEIFNNLPVTAIRRRWQSIATKIRSIRDVRRLLDIHGGIKKPSALPETHAAGIRHLNPAHWSAP